MSEPAISGVPDPVDAVADDRVDNTPMPEAPPVESRPSIEKFQTWEDLEKGYKELETYRGNSLRIPTSEAGDQAWGEFREKLARVPGVMEAPNMEDPESVAAFYKALGRPEDPNGYGFEPIDELSGLTPDDDAAFAEAALNANLTREQANAIRGHLAGNLVEAEKEAQSAAIEAVGSLKEEWGKAYEHNIALAKAAATQLNDRLPGIEDYMNSVDPKGIFDVNTVKMLNIVAGMMGESGAIDTGRPKGIMTPDEAMLQAQDIRNNPEHPYNNELDPAHQAAQKHMADLYKIAYQR